LRRQATKTAVDGHETFGRSFEPVRLDPLSLPHRFRYDTGIDPRSGQPMGEAAVMLEAHVAQVSRRLPSGIPMAMRLPMSAFEGVAVRVIPETDGAGEGLVVVELLHRDPQLSLPLSVAASVDDVVADWRAWARVLALPMLLVEVDGTWRTIEERLGSVVVKAVRPRRHRSVMNGRRPRFLIRRKVGVMPAEPVIVEGREIIARH